MCLRMSTGRRKDEGERRKDESEKTKRRKRKDESDITKRRKRKDESEKTKRRKRQHDALVLYSLQVFQHIISCLPRRAAVQYLVADFEKAAWNAARSVFPGIGIRGCNFHWEQAVWRKAQELGLQVIQ